MGKNHPGQNLPNQRPSDKSSRTKTPQTIEREFVQGLLSGFFVLGLLKMGESEMCDVLWGVPGCVTNCDRGRGSKLVKNSMTYFMDRPKSPHSLCGPTRFSVGFGLFL